jgi:hypothetical protein
MDGGNILYLNTVGIPHSWIHPTRPHSTELSPGKQALPLVQIYLSITFGDRANFLTEILTFEVVVFIGSYHILLGQSCYAKYMAISNSAYLELKMQGPHDVIILSVESK